MGGVKAVLLLGLCAVGTARALTRAEVEEIRHFASKAYGGKGPEVQDSRGSFSHYVGRRMKPLTVQQPYTVFMKPVARPYFEPQISGSVNNYNFAPFRNPNFLAPPPSFGRFQSPPPPPKFRFGGGPSFSYSFPPGPPSGYAKRPPHQLFHSYPGIPVRNGQQQQQPQQVHQFQIQHDQKLQAVMSQQHQLNVQQAKSQVEQQNLKVKGNEIKKQEVKKVKEEVKPVNIKQQNNVKSNEITKFTQAFSYAPQTHETVPAEVFTRHLMHPADFTMTPYGPAVPAIMQAARFPVPVRYEHVTPMAFHYRPQQSQPVHMTTVYQSEAYPEYSYHSGPNHNFVRFQSFIAPSVVPIVATQSPKPTEESKQVEQQGSEVKPTNSEVVGSTITTIPSQEGEQVIFESARIPEDVIARRPGGSSQSRPYPLTPQEQRNVFTAAADSSMVVAPLVWSEDSASPIKGDKTADSVSSSEVTEETSTSRTVTRSKKEEGVSSTVTKVLPGGKRVRLRKVRVSPKEKANASTSSS